MNVPLGFAIGNANEVRESVEVLAGGGPADVVELTIALAREMLDLAGVKDADVEAALKDGRAMDTWRAMISAQGGDPDAALPAPKETHVVNADRDGILVKQEALPFGIAAWRLGAGRARKEDPVQHAAGHRAAREAGRHREEGSAAVHARRRRAGTLRAGARGRRGRVGDRRSGLAGRRRRPADRRPRRLS